MINWSGGLDSTYTFYKFVSLNPGKRLLVHHIDLKTHTNRYLYERKAVEDCIRWFNNNGLGDRFKYIETKFDYGDLNHNILDVQLVGFLTGIVLMDRWGRNVTNIIRSAPKDEYERLGWKKLAERHSLAQKTRELICPRHLNILEPIKEMRKTAVWDATPEELRALTWSCRRPNNDGSVCGRCHSCAQIRGYESPIIHPTYFTGSNNYKTYPEFLQPVLSDVQRTQNISYP